MAATGFTGTDNTELTAADANWSKANGYTGALEFVGTDTVRQTNTTAAVYKHATAPASAEQDVSMSVVAPSSGRGTTAIGILLRWDDATRNGYRVLVNANDSAFQMSKITAGVVAALGANVAWPSPPTSGQVKTLRAVISGTNPTTIELYWDGAGAPNVTRTDSSSPHTGVGQLALHISTTGTPTDTAGFQARNFADNTTGGGGSSIIPIASNSYRLRRAA